jgi:tetratricopeptide (TPR) repeat protein
VGVLSLNSWQQAKLYASSREFWRDAVARNPESWLAQYNLGNTFLKTSPEVAIGYYREAIRLKPDCAPAHFNLAEALEREGKLQEALAEYEAVSGIEPSNTAALSETAYVLMNLGRADEAAARFREVLSRAPGSAEAHYALAGVLALQGKTSEAMKEYEQVLRLKPDDAPSRNNLARLLASEGRAAETEAHYRAALAKTPDSPIILRNLAWLLASVDDPALRRPAEALALAERACAQTEYGDWGCLDALAAALAANERFDEAVTSAKKALALAAAAGQAEKARKIAARVESYQRREALHFGRRIPLE